MVVVAILAVLSTLAMSAPDESEPTTDGVASQLVFELDQARLRAMSSHRWQRVTVAGQLVYVEQGNTLGMVVPTAWSRLATIEVPSDVRVVSIAAASSIEPTGAAAPAGVGLAQGVAFAPDGSSAARTIYLQTRMERDPSRVVVFAATGSAVVRRGW